MQAASCRLQPPIDVTPCFLGALMTSSCGIQKRFFSVEKWRISQCNPLVLKIGYNPFFFGKKTVVAGDGQPVFFRKKNGLLTHVYIPF